jgi:diguanylate cyclase (GGDEF)-like protein
MNSKKIVQLILAVFSFILITVLILLLDGIIEFWPLYFIPVLLAVFSYDLWGGIVSAVLVDVFSFILAYLKFSVGELSLANFVAIDIGLAIVLLVGVVFGYLLKSKEALSFGSDKFALVDKLTGLYNYGYFKDRLEEEKERSDRFGSKVSVALLDVDYFKSFNEKFGYSKGDQLLKKLAQVCKEQIRAVDIPVRYGGEEFAVIMPNTGPVGANEVAERLKSSVEQTEFEGTERKPKIKRTISIGVATYPDHARSIDELIELTESALLTAKNAGRNRVYIYGTGK